MKFCLKETRGVTLVCEGRTPGEKSSSQHALGLLVVHLKVSSNIIRQIKSRSEGGDSDKV